MGYNDYRYTVYYTPSQKAGSILKFPTCFSFKIDQYAILITYIAVASFNITVHSKFMV